MSKRMKKLKLYLETSVWNFLLAEDASEKRRITEAFFEEVVTGPYSLHISTLVIEGLDHTKEAAKRQALLELVRRYAPEMLAELPEIERLADQFITQGVIPQKYSQEATHLAYAYVHDMDVLVSWNQKHIVKLKTRWLAGAIAQFEGYKPIEISTPEEVFGMSEGSKTLEELHKIREEMYEERKHLSPEERAELSNRRAQEIVQKYGLKLKIVKKPATLKS